MADEVTYNSAETEVTEAEPSVPDSPFCQMLRSKKFFMFDGLATDPSQYLDGSNHCWCYETQQVMGPDGGRVEPELCVPGRSCYLSAFAS